MTTVELFIGPYRSGKTLRLLAELINYKLTNPLAKVTILVPSIRSGNLFSKRLRDEADRTFVKGLFDVQIISFHQLCSQIIRCTKPNIKILNKELRLAIMSEILKNLVTNKSWEILAPLAEFPGSARAVLELIDEFQRACISPADLELKIEKNSFLPAHFFELAKAYTAYWHTQDKLSFFDQKRLEIETQKSLFSTQPPDLNLDLLVIDSFDRVSNLQAQIFAGLAHQAKRVLMSFDYPFDNVAFSDARETLRQSPKDYQWKKSSLEQLKKNLPSSSIKVQPQENFTVPKITISKALDKFAEMLNIANLCKESIIKEHINPEDILVTARDLDSYVAPIEHAFKNAGLPFFIDHNESIAIPTWQFLKSILTLSLKDFIRQDLLEILHNPQFNLAKAHLTADQVNSLDQISYKEKVYGGIKEWEKFFAAGHCKNIAHSIKQLFLELTLPQAVSPCLEYVRYIENVLDKFIIYSTKTPDKTTLEWVSEREVIYALRKSCKSLVLEEELLLNPPQEFSVFLTKLFSHVDNSSFIRPQPVGQFILICSAQQAPNKVFKKIFLAGVTEGAFPQRQKDSGFLRNEELDRWLSVNVDLCNPRNEPSFERALFLSFFERANVELSLSYSEFNLDGSELLPSFFLSEFQSLSNLPVNSIDAVGSNNNSTSAHHYFSKALWSNNWHDISTFNNDLLKDFQQDISEPILSCLARSNPSSSALYCGDLRDLITTKALTAHLPETWSASRLNDYGCCPFRFWASHLLHIEPRDEPQLGLNTRLRGQFFHKCLEICFKALADKDWQFKSPDLETAIFNSFTQALSWLEEQRDFHPNQYWTQEKKELLFRVRRFILREMERITSDSYGYLPRFFEVSFGMDMNNDNSYDKFIINDTPEPIALRGKIDRIDIDKNVTTAGQSNMRVKLVDYKSGSTHISEEDARSGRNIQLPIYALAVENVILPGSKVSQANYLSVMQAKSTGRLDFSSKHADIPERTQELVKVFVHEIKQGNFSLKPSNNKVCTSCPHATICRIKELSPRYRQGDNDADFN